MALFVCVALLPSALRGGLVLDDAELIFENPAINGGLSWWQALTRDYFHHLGGSGTWRPLATASLRLDHSLFGAHVELYHLSNLVLHGAVVWLVAALLSEKARSFLALLAAAGLFALHPALCDATVWIAGRTSMLSALGPLAGVLWLSRRGETVAAMWKRCAVVCVALLAGLLAKEDALVFAPLLVAVSWRAPGGRAAGALGVGLALLLYGLGRAYALESWGVGPQTPVLQGAGLVERAGLSGLALLEAARVVVWPLDFPPRYTPELLLEHGDRWLGVRLSALVGWALWVALVAPAVLGLVRRGAAGLSLTRLALALMGLAFVPFLQLIPIGEVLAPRFLYLPLLLSTPVLLAALERWRPGPKRSATLCTLLVGLALSSYGRAGDYVDAGAWNTAVLRHSPRDVRSWNNLGLHREDRGDLDGAVAAWEQAASLDPSYSKPWSNLGRLHYEAGELEEAERAWSRALELGPRNPIAHVNLASLHTRRGDHARAAGLYARATELAPGLAAAWRGLALARLRLGELELALSSIGQALALDPGDRAARTLEERIQAAAEERESRR